MGSIQNKYIWYVESRYRRTPKYERVRKELISVAEQRGTVTYKTIAHLMGLAPSGCHMVNEVGHMLGEISEDECKRGRPMLSAVVTRVTGKMGQGFFELARKLGKLKDVSEEAKERFWEEEKARVYEIWGDHRNGKTPQSSAP